MAKHEIPCINVEQREQLGTREAARLRTGGRLPAVIYGHSQASVHISMDTKQITDLLRRNTHVLEVAFDSTRESCLIKQVQWDHLGTAIVHLDLTRVDLDERVTTMVDLILAGDAVGLKNTGAILTRLHSTIEIECQVLSIPENISFDISDLDIGKPLTVSDLPLPEGVRCTLDQETVLVSISIVAEEPEEEEKAVEAAEGEPEVIMAREEENADEKEKKE